MWISGEKYHQQIKIKDEAIGYDYGTVFGQYLDPTLTEVVVEDPYIRYIHQVRNVENTS